MWETPLVDKHFSQDSCIVSRSGACIVVEEAGDELKIFFFLLNLFAVSCGVSSSISLTLFSSTTVTILEEAKDELEIFNFFLDLFSGSCNASISFQTLFSSMFMTVVEEAKGQLEMWFLFMDLFCRVLWDLILVSHLYFFLPQSCHLNFQLYHLPHWRIQ